MKYIDATTLRGWITKIFEAAGLRSEAAFLVADHLVEANLRGVDSHGVLRVPIYVERLRAGVVNPAPRPRVVRQHRGVALVDGDNGPGQVAGMFATDLVIRLAEQYGVGVVCVRNSTHYGAAAYYVERIAKAGFVGLTTTNAEPRVVPYGGAKPALGTNPIAFAAEAPQGMLVLDMATSQVAMGKIYFARERNEPIPEGWAVDEAGRPTTDPHKAQACLPLGGPKGFGLGLMVEVLSGVLTGAAILNEIGRMLDFSHPQNVGHFFLALDPEYTVGRKVFRERLGKLWDAIKATSPAPGFAEVLIPGELEERTRHQRLKGGIPIPEQLYNKLVQLSEALGVPVPAT